MDCTYFQNKLSFSVFILSLSHDLVLGKPMNVVLMCVLELLNPAILCLLQQLLVGCPCCSSTECHQERTGATLLSSDCSMVCHGCGVFSYPFVNNCHSGYIWKCRFFFNTLDVFIVKTCYECVVLGISFCVNKASRSMHEVLSLLTVSGLWVIIFNGLCSQSPFLYLKF